MSFTSPRSREAAHPAGAGGPCLPRWRRARRLPGRRLSGDARSRHRTGLGHRHLDRSHQRRHHRRQRINSRLERLREFWRRIERKPQWGDMPFGSSGRQRRLVPHDDVRRHSRLFFPNRAMAWGLNASVGVEHAAFYTIDDLRKTVGELVDFERISSQTAAADRRSRQRANRQDALFRQPQRPDHARPRARSGAVPPGFPAVRIDGDPLLGRRPYSNTPVEVVFDDNPRRNSVVFSVQIFPIAGPEPESVMQVLSRQKDIQFASRADSHIPRQEHIHQLRHMVRELVRLLPENQRETPKVKEMAGYGCGTLMHIVQLNATPLQHEDYLRDLDFTPDGIDGAGRPVMPTPSAPCSASPGKRRSTRWSASRSTIPTAKTRRPAWKKPAEQPSTDWRRCRRSCGQTCPEPGRRDQFPSQSQHFEPPAGSLYRQLTSPSIMPASPKGRLMAGYDLSIRTKLALWAGVGVLLVAGMLAEQQYGDHLAKSQRIAADNKQLAAVEALRAADDLRRMQIAVREIRLAIAPSEIDRAVKRSTPRKRRRRSTSRWRSRPPTNRRTRSGSSNSPGLPKILPERSATSPPRRRTMATPSKR